MNFYRASISNPGAVDFVDFIEAETIEEARDMFSSSLWGEQKIRRIFPDKKNTNFKEESREKINELI